MNPELDYSTVRQMLRAAVFALEEIQTQWMVRIPTLQQRLFCLI
jgi:hypothetical protein